ncbi:PKS-NRPS hybrid synthetase psoA [Cladobotryum mycophilum]|uniref:PKS-NRPS hybrid synthetase psoA n=1 Tax=Cladobotryum mycophilum TaxID=491253 RepID=A0ABR0SQ79_9HYPO
MAVTQMDHDVSNATTNVKIAKCGRIGQLSPGQEVFYSWHQSLEDKTIYNLVMDGRVHGFLDSHRLNAALRSVATKYEALRTLFFMNERNGKPFQVVHDQPQIILEQKGVYDEADIQMEIEKLRNFPFDLETAPLMRVLLLSLPAAQHIVYLVHHIAMDGFSWQVL